MPSFILALSAEGTYSFRADSRPVSVKGATLAKLTSQYGLLSRLAFGKEIEVCSSFALDALEEVLAESGLTIAIARKERCLAQSLCLGITDSRERATPLSPPRVFTFEAA